MGQWQMIRMEKVLDWIYLFFHRHVLHIEGSTALLGEAAFSWDNGKNPNGVTVVGRADSQRGESSLFDAFAAVTNPLFRRHEMGHLALDDLKRLAADRALRRL